MSGGDDGTDKSASEFSQLSQPSQASQPAAPLTVAETEAGKKDGARDGDLKGIIAPMDLTHIDLEPFKNLRINMVRVPQPDWGEAGTSRSVASRTSDPLPLPMEETFGTLERPYSAPTCLRVDVPYCFLDGDEDPIEARLRLNRLFLALLGREFRHEEREADVAEKQRELLEHGVISRDFAAQAAMEGSLAGETAGSSANEAAGAGEADEGNHGRGSLASSSSTEAGNGGEGSAEPATQDGQMEGQKDGSKDGPKDGQRDGQRDGGSGGQRRRLRAGWRFWSRRRGCWRGFCKLYCCCWSGGDV